MAHQKWISSILEQMKEIKLGLRGYKYLDNNYTVALLSQRILLKNFSKKNKKKIKNKKR